MPPGMKRQAPPSIPSKTCPHVLLLPNFVAPAAACDAAGRGTCSLCVQERPISTSASPTPEASNINSNGLVGTVEGRVRPSFQSGDGVPHDIEMCLTCGFVLCSCHMRQHCRDSSSSSSDLCHSISICFRTYTVHCFSCAFSPTTPCPSAAIAKKHIAALRMAAKTRDKLVMTPGRLVRTVTSGLIGLKNGGNTCFANSVVQSLANIPLFPSTLFGQQHLLPNGSRQNSTPIPASFISCDGNPLAHNPALPSDTLLSTVGGGDAPPGVAVFTPRMLSFAPLSPPPLDLNSSGDGQEAGVPGMERRVGRSRGRGRPAADARTVSPIVPPATLAHVDISTSPLMAPGVCNSPGIAVGSSFRVRIGERAITDGLCALLQAMLKPQVSQPPLTTNALLSLLQKMAPPALTLGRTAAPSWLQENTQQDCHEFLRYLLSCVSDEHALFFDPPSPSSLPPPINPSAIFTGAIVSRVQCKRCGHSSERHELFSDLSLPLPVSMSAVQGCTARLASKAILQETLLLDDCVRSFFEAEQLSQGNEWFCSACKLHTPATKCQFITHMPAVLCVHLKRFAWIEQNRVKLATHVAFPSILRLNQRYINAGGMSDGDGEYELASVVNHHGSTISGGHYTAFCKQRLVSSVTWEDVAASQAYLLFYIKRPADIVLRERAEAAKAAAAAELERTVQLQSRRRSSSNSSSDSDVPLLALKARRDGSGRA